jgi:glutathione S-transferase
VKPYLKALEEGVAESDIIHNNTKEVEAIVEFLRIVKERSIGTSKFLFGDHPTWADFYLYPPLADLQALPFWEQAVSGSRFVTWMGEMGQLDAVKRTRSGTLAEQHGK